MQLSESNLSLRLILTAVFFHHSDQFTLPMMGLDNTAWDSAASVLSGRSPCMVVDSSSLHLTNAGYVLIDSSHEMPETPTASPDSDTFKYALR